MDLAVGGSNFANYPVERVGEENVAQRVDGNSPRIVNISSKGGSAIGAEPSGASADDGLNDRGGS